MINTRRLFRIARPIQLLLAALTFSLGAGISHYLGQPTNLLVFAVGLMAVLSVQAASAWLAEQFRLPLTPLNEGETPADRENLRVALMQSSYAALTLAGAIIVSLIVTGRLNPSSAAIFGVMVVFMIAYALPPLHLAELGFGELIMAIYLGTLSPAFAYMLENGEVHRLLTFATFPLTLLALAYFLINDFPTYATDLKLGRQTLLTRLTWQRAIPIHHLLLLGAYLLFAAAPFFGFPWGLVWPPLVVLVFAAVQIIWLQRISMGGPTLWTFITTLSLATFGLTAYLLAFTFWTR